MDKSKIHNGIKNILEGLGEDLNREGLRNTPERFSSMCFEIFNGYSDSPPSLSIFNSPTEDSMVAMRDIPFYSICEHHFLPFFGEINLVYLPGNQKITGFSEIVHVVRHFSHQLQIQERLTSQIANYINENLNPKGLLVISHATQLCMSMRGVKSVNARTEVISHLGDFKNNQALRQEAIGLLK